MAKILLLNLPIIRFYDSDQDILSTYNPPLGLLYLASSIRMSGHDVLIEDLYYKRMRQSELLRIVDSYKPDVVGISVYTENVDEAFQLCRGIKKKHPKILTLLGGPHASLDPVYTISNKYVDFVITHEGEASIIELLEAVESEEATIKYKDIKGIVLKMEDGTIFRNKKRYDISDLDLLVFPLRNEDALSTYGQMINLITSRGCPGNCIYCAATALSGAKYRTRTVENTILEIAYLLNVFGDNLKVIYMQDDTFTAITERVYEFIRIKKQLRLSFQWRCESRVDVITEDMISQLAENNCVGMAFGVESGSQEVLDKIHKHIDLEQVERVVKWTYENKIYTSLNFMLGHYCDTPETMSITHEFIERMYEQYHVGIFVSFNTPFPGTCQHAQMDKLEIKLILDGYSQYSVLSPSIEGKGFTVDDQVNVYSKLMKILMDNDYGIR